MVLSSALLVFPCIDDCVVGWARSVLANACSTLLCLLVQRSSMRLFVQHDFG